MSLPAKSDGPTHDPAREPSIEGFPGGRTITARGIEGPTFNRFLGFIYARIVRWAMAMKVPYDEACEIAQIVSIRIWKMRFENPLFLPTIQAGLRAVRGWTGNAVKDRYRLATRREAAHTSLGRRIDEEIARSCSTEESTALRELNEAHNAAIRTLSAQLREVYVLVVGVCWTVPDSAEMLGLHPKTVANRLSRANKVVRAHLTAAGYAGFAS